METYDPTKVGARIARGRSHSVYHYGDAEVIRFPNAERWFSFMFHDGLDIHDRLKRDISLCEKYLGDYFLATRLVESPHREIATIQPYITGHYLSKKDLQAETTRRHFQEMVRRYETMSTTGYEVDLIGQGGILRRCLSNVFVLPGGTLKLFDATAVDMKNISNTHVTLLIAKLVLARQRSTIRFLLS